MRSWSMNRRLLVTLTGLIGVLWIAGMTASAIMMRHEIDEVFDSALQETAQRILPLAVDGLGERRENDGAYDDRLEDGVSDDHVEYILYQVRDASGRLLLRSHDAQHTPFAVPTTRGYFDDGVRRYFTEWSADRSIVIQVAELPTERAEAVQALWLGHGVPLIVVLPLAALAIRATVSQMTKPVRKLQGELAARDGTNLAPIVGEGLPTELAPVASGVNRLLTRLSAALEAERAFASNSAHELRNPIAAAQAQASLLVAGATSDDQRHRAIALVTLLATLGRKAETLLQLARVESGIALARERISLRDLVALLVTDWSRKPTAIDRLIVEDRANGPLTVMANADALGMAIQNLIGNALKHSPARSRVTVSLGPATELSVRSEGDPVAPEDLARLKERFARAAKDSKDGSGLGLYIADMIARQSGAHLDLYSPARGSQVGFEAVLSW